MNRGISREEYRQLENANADNGSDSSEDFESRIPIHADAKEQAELMTPLVSSQKLTKEQKLKQKIMKEQEEINKNYSQAYGKQDRFKSANSRML